MKGQKEVVEKVIGYIMPKQNRISMCCLYTSSYKL